MFKFLKGLFKDKIITYEKPLLFAYSALGGFDTLIEAKPFVMVLMEDQIPVDIEYFLYLGDGKFVRRKKHDLSGGGLNTTMPADLVNRVLDYSAGSGDFSVVHSADNIGRLAFNARNRILGRDASCDAR